MQTLQIIMIVRVWAKKKYWDIELHTQPYLDHGDNFGTNGNFWSLCISPSDPAQNAMRIFFAFVMCCIFFCENNTIKLALLSTTIGSFAIIFPTNFKISAKNDKNLRKSMLFFNFWNFASYMYVKMWIIQFNYADFKYAKIAEKYASHQKLYKKQDFLHKKMKKDRSA